MSPAKGGPAALGWGWIPPRVPSTFGCGCFGNSAEERQEQGEEEEGEGMCPKPLHLELCRNG